MSNVHAPVDVFGADRAHPRLPQTGVRRAAGLWAACLRQVAVVSRGIPLDQLVQLPRLLVAVPLHDTLVDERPEEEVQVEIAGLAEGRDTGRTGARSEEVRAAAFERHEAFGQRAQRILGLHVADAVAEVAPPAGTYVGNAVRGAPQFDRRSGRCIGRLHAPAACVRGEACKNEGQQGRADGGSMSMCAHVVSESVVLRWRRTSPHDVQQVRVRAARVNISVRGSSCPV
jgi:hypothetical protein